MKSESVAVCGACGVSITICAECGGKICTEECEDRLEDGCLCTDIAEEDDEDVSA